MFALFLPPSFPPSLLPWLPPPCCLSLFQGWWLWLESLHRWQASLPSGEGLHSLNFLHFPSFLQLKLLAHNFSRLASLYLAVHDAKGEGRDLGEARGAYIKCLSCLWINRGHQYQWNATPRPVECRPRLCAVEPDSPTLEIVPFQTLCRQCIFQSH